jgi:hypothetical protein
MKYLPVFPIILIALFMINGCSSQSKSSSNGSNYNYDMQTDLKLKLKSMPLTKSALSIADAPFCQFSKYEVTVYFVYIALYDPSGGNMKGTSKHTLVNLPEGSGIKVNLVSNSLSSMLSSSMLEIKDPAGNAVDKMYVGLGTNVVVCGYLYSNQVLCRTTSNSGIITDEGLGYPPEDCNIKMGGSEGIPAYSVDETHPPLNTNVHSAYVWIASGGRVHGHDPVTLVSDELLSYVFPLDFGICHSYSGWQSIDTGASTVFVPSSTIYRKFYLKRSSSDHYTDFVRFLTDKHNRVILGQGYGSSFDSGDPDRIFNGSFKIWYSADTDTNNVIYPVFWHTNTENSVYFNSEQSNVTCSNFILTNHSGTMIVNSNSISYDCIEVE